MILFAATNENIQGAYNAVAPMPATNKKIVELVAKKLFPLNITVKVPAFVLKIMLGEMSIEVLKSANVSSKKMQEAGFQFDYPSVEEALSQLLKK
jgi:NAD dependent epimerase/dehydratase family enzyme